MLLPNSVGYGYLIATGGLGIVGLVFANKFLTGHPKEGKVRLFGGVLTGLAVLGLVAYWLVCTDVIRITATANGTPTTAKFFSLFGSSVTVDGKVHELASNRSGTWIVNELADQMAYVEVREYGEAIENPPEGIMIPPKTVGLFGGNIDLIGPGNAPPESVSSKSSSELRAWLSWMDAGSFEDLVDPQPD